MAVNQLILFNRETGRIVGVVSGKSAVPPRQVAGDVGFLSVISPVAIKPREYLVKDGQLVRQSTIRVSKEVAHPRVFLVGDTPRVHTGFGNQLGIVGSGLSRAGFKVEYHGLGEVKDWNTWDCDLVISLSELVQVSSLVDSPKPPSSWVHWLPVTSSEIRGAFTERVGRVPNIVAMSKFGRGVLESAPYLRKVPVIPHAVDMSVFRSPGPGERRSWRRDMGFSETEVVFLFVGTNTSRKKIGVLLEAFSKMFRECGVPVGLVLKTSWKGSVDIREKAAQLGITVPETMSLRVISDDLNSLDMAKLYGASDCFVTAAAGEGFGIPLVEAKACGMPFIAGRNSVFPEFAGPEDSLVSCVEEENPLYDGTVVWWPPQVDKLALAMREFVQNIRGGQVYNRTGIRQSVQGKFGCELVVSMWVELVRGILSGDIAGEN